MNSGGIYIPLYRLMMLETPVAVASARGNEGGLHLYLPLGERDLELDGDLDFEFDTDLDSKKR